MPVFSNCCCCWPLKSGVLVLGCVGVVFSTLNMAAVALFPSSQGPTTVDTDINGIRDICYITGLIDCLIPELVVLTIYLCCYALLIAGAQLDMRYLLVPLLITFLLGLAVGGTFSVLRGILLTFNGSGGIKLLGKSLIRMALKTYIWFCIYSLFQELTEKANQDKSDAV